MSRRALPVVAGTVLALGAAACAGGSGARQAGSPAADPAAPPAGVAVAASLRDSAQLLFTRALEDNLAIVQLQRLVAAAPRRLSGSPGADAAVRFAVQAMGELGLDHVRAEPVQVPRWVRGVETAAVVAPRALPLRVTALGGSVPTPPPGVQAEVVRVTSFEALHRLGEAARGKIVFFDRPMPRARRRTFQAYGEAVPQRSDGAIEAARAGGVAALVRSMSTTIDGNPHTGAMRYDAALPRVPAAAIATEDAETLAALLAQGPVTVQLVLGCRTEPDAMSANVVGEITGASRPGEIVLLGAHLDAWDLGNGAHDDGAGCAHVLEAMRLIKACGLRPARTVRAVLFMNEENGLRGAQAYLHAHGDEPHAAAIESDTGGFTPEGFTSSLRGERAAAVRRDFLPLGEFGAGLLLEGGEGGADIEALGSRGVPLFGLVTDSARYFDYHHTAQDTLDKVNERELALGAAALAYAAAVLADRP